jgi:hypothetical protein
MKQKVLEVHFYRSKGSMLNNHIMLKLVEPTYGFTGLAYLGLT